MAIFSPKNGKTIHLRNSNIKNDINKPCDISNAKIYTKIYTKIVVTQPLIF